MVEYGFDIFIMDWLIEFLLFIEYKVNIFEIN